MFHKIAALATLIVAISFGAFALDFANTRMAGMAAVCTLVAAIAFACAFYAYAAGRNADFWNRVR